MQSPYLCPGVRLYEYMLPRGSPRLRQLHIPNIYIYYIQNIHSKQDFSLYSHRCYSPVSSTRLPFPTGSLLSLLSYQLA
jgi:hypothetical protein